MGTADKVKGVCWEIKGKGQWRWTKGEGRGDFGNENERGGCHHTHIINSAIGSGTLWVGREPGHVKMEGWI